MSTWLSISRAIGTLRSALVEPSPQRMLVLTVRMILRGGESAVGLALTLHDAATIYPATNTTQPLAGDTSDAVPDGPPDIGFEWEIPASGFFHGDQYLVPTALTEQLAESVAKLDAQEHAGPLWLRLQRPYCLLGLVPWETELERALNRAVLRLPEYPFRATERPDALENVILVDPPGSPDAPCGIEAAPLRARLRLVIGAILAGSSRRDTRIHIFPRQAWHAALQEFDGTDAAVTLHDPASFKSGEAGSAPERPDSTVTPWTAWLLARMDRGIDAVHLLGRATLQDGEGNFSLSATPLAAARRQCDVELSVDDLALLMNRAGAWSLSLTPLVAADAPAMAFLADALAHRWQGAVLFVAGEETAQALTQAARLLYTVTSVEAPRLQRGFLYCHPDFLKCGWDTMLSALPPLLGQHAALLAMRAPLVERVMHQVARVLPGTDNAMASVPPSWLSATQRFLEKELFDDVRRQSNDVLLSQLATGVRRGLESMEVARAKEKLLGEVREVVARYSASHDK